MKKNVKNKDLGITLIALVITVIVLLILAGISISMLSGDNGLLKRAGQARDDTVVGQEKEQVELAYVSAAVNNLGGNVTAQNLQDELDSSVGNEKTDVSQNEDNTLNVYFTDTKHNYNVNLGKVSKIESVDRTGINIGDYVTYIPPTNTDGTKKTYTLSNSVSGYNSGTSQSITQEYTIWRVLKINNDGSLVLIADVKSTNKNIYFRNAIGYNNGVYLLHDICENLYSNTQKGITARSINMEDITNNMQTGDNISIIGLMKIKKYQDDNVSEISSSSTVSNIDTSNNTISYIENTYYPNIYAHQIGAGINITDVYKNGDMDSSGKTVITESEKYYKSTTSETRTKANSLTSQYTYYKGVVVAEDFLDCNDNVSDIYNVLFNTNTTYWIASRYVGYALDNNGCATFGLRYIDNSKIDGYNVAFSHTKSNYTSNKGNHICPIIYLDSSVQLTVSESANTSTGTPHTVLTE